MTLALYNAKGQFERQIRMPADFDVFEATIRHGLSYYRCLCRVGRGAAIFGCVA